MDSDRISSGRTEGFFRIVTSAGEMSYDVTKTDSLVSPYTAYIKLSFLEQGGIGPTQVALSDPSSLKVATVNHWDLMYALQDGKWKFQEARYSFEMPLVNIGKTAPAHSDIKILTNRISGSEVCLPT